MQSDQVVVEVTGSAVAVVPDAARPPAAMPAAPGATTLVDLVLADAGGRAAFERMPQLTLRIEDTTADRLMSFLAMPDGSTALLRLLDLDGGAGLRMTIREVGSRVLLLEFATRGDAEDFARRFPAERAPRAAAPAELDPAPRPGPREYAHLHAEMKPVVVVGTPTLVRVRLTRGHVATSVGADADRADGGIDPLRDVEVTLVPRGFRFAVGSRRTRRLRLPSGSGEAEARFRIVGVEPGHGELSIVVRQEAELPLATLRLTAEVVNADGNGLTGLARQTAAVLAPDPRIAALPTIRIDEELVGGRSTLHLAVAVGGRSHRFTVKLRDKSAYVAGIHDRVAVLREELERAPEADRADLARRRMQQIGGSLFEDLFDVRARELLWEHRDELDGLIVQTTGEVDLPWEIVHITGPDTDAAGAPRFLAGYGLTRWVYDTAHPTSIPIRPGRARYLCPVYTSPRLVLRHAGAECDGIFSRFAARPVEPDEARALGRLVSGGFDLLHFSGIARWSPVTARRQELLLGAFDGDSPANGSAYTDGDVRRDLPDHPIPDAAGGPLVFLDACDVGLPAGDVGLGGFAEAFLRGGAGAFVGRSWSVGDERASRFVDAFYDALLAGGTISAATREAREAARAEGDLSGLAYAVYAHPDARIRVG